MLYWMHDVYGDGVTIHSDDFSEMLKTLYMFYPQSPEVDAFIDYVQYGEDEEEEED